VASSRTAKTESSARLADPVPGDLAPVAITSIAAIDRLRVKDSFQRISSSPHFAMEYLYARLFAHQPEMRALFPFSMEQTRAAAFRMLAELIEHLDDPETADRLLDGLGADHRKFGLKDHHYRPFFDAMLTAIGQVSGSAWTPEVARAWQTVLAYFAARMKASAAEDARAQPAWWIGEIVQHDQRTPSVAVLTIRPDRPLHYEPGQYISVQVPKWPRVWRKFSIANAPRENGLLDIHVRAVPAGLVSTALVSHSGTGDIVTLAAARGDLRVPADPDHDIVCVAGGTGLAPVKAIVEAVIGAGRPGKRRSVTLYVGARRSSELYDLRDLATLRLAYPALTLVQVVESEPYFSGPTGRLPEVVKTHASFRNTEVYVAGPAGLVSATVQALAHRVPSERFHHDPLDLLQAASRPRPADRLRI
jgi:NAD(P)H-flavin reductase/hemoglobin-like flavoprotein